jgi:2-dehydro-3-deoxyphosphogluconate aldolase / (4S)-4-hydroxy-2-oxoglutarate aldolase
VGAMTGAEVVDAFGTHRLVAIVRVGSGEDAAGIAVAAAAGGVRALEVTTDVPRWENVLIRLCDELGDGVLLGAGTVTRAEQVDRLVAAGARFAVSPYLCPPVVEAAAAAGIPAVPGAMTPGEVAAALDAGAPLVKLFPADVLGPVFLRAVRQVLPALRAVPTGGVGEANGAAWLDAGAFALGVGSPFRQAWERGGPDEVSALARRLSALAQRPREG